MRRLVAVLVLLSSVLLLPGVAYAAPPPTPPPNPSDTDLAAGQAAVGQRAAQVAALTGRLSALDGQAADLQLQLSARQEQANRATVDRDSAKTASDEASAAATAAQSDTAAADRAVDELQARVDGFLSARYQEGLDLGPLGLLTAPGGPQAVLDRAAFADLVAQQQQQALDGLNRATVEKANADSLARQARDRAQDRAAAAQKAAEEASAVVAQVAAQTKAQAALLAQVQAQRDDVNKQLDAAIANDATLRAQRDRFLAWQAEQEALAAARAAAAQRTALTQLDAPAAGGARGVRTVIARAMSQLGVRYSWGGGNGRGPTMGVRDGGVADSFGDFRKVGFDCSGLMMYAFAGVGVSLPHYSGYQYTSGRQVPVSQRRPGDMLFFAEGGVIGHVALYVGNNMMIEAPYSGAAVRLVPMRFGGLMPNVTRML